MVDKAEEYDNDKNTVEIEKERLSKLLGNSNVEIITVKNYQDYTDFILSKNSLKERNSLEKLKEDETLTDRFSFVECNARFPTPEVRALYPKEKTLALRRNAYPLTTRPQHNSSPLPITSYSKFLSLLLVFLLILNFIMQKYTPQQNYLWDLTLDFIEEKFSF